MNTIKVVACLAFAVLASGYEHSYMTHAEHPAPMSNYHQQDHHENAELNHQIYVHESDGAGHGAADGHESYGYLYDQGDHGNTGHHEQYIHGGEAAGHMDEAPADEGHIADGHGTESHGHDEHVDYYHHPAYKYEYGVDDPKTKDHHSQWEHRDGDVVHGEYTLKEADGTIRKVTYSSDKHKGFTAHVERIGHGSHPATSHKEHEGDHHIEVHENSEHRH